MADAMRVLTTVQPELVPEVYALDVLVPIVEFDQRAHWHPALPYAWGAWAAVVVGWVLVTALVAGLANVFRRS